MKNEKKLNILHELSSEGEPISTIELAKKLGNKYGSRSIRRWLNVMINEGLVEKIGQKKGARYRVKNRAERKGNHKANCFSQVSTNVINKIKAPIYQRTPITYNDQWFASYQPNITQFIPPEIKLKLQKAGSRCKKENPAGTYAHQIFNRLLIDLSYNSSRLEGNTYSLLDTQKLVLEGKDAKGKLEEEKIMILNHKEAIRYLVDNASKIEITEETIFTLHYLLSDSLVDARHGGKIRDHGVRIGGSTYIPFEGQQQLATRFKQILEKAKLIQDPYEQSLFLLTFLSYLQAFTDVNKRTSRLSANIPLIKNNLVPLSFIDVEREDYTSAVLAIYEFQDINPLLDLYVFSYMRTCALYDATVNTISYDEIRVRYRQERRALIRNIILNKLSGETLKTYIHSEAEKIVQQQDLPDFINDLMEDLREINVSRIVGLGVTPDDLQSWLAITNTDTFLA